MPSKAFFKTSTSAATPAARCTKGKQAKVVRDGSAKKELDRPSGVRTTKSTLIVELLNRPEGASIEDMMRSSGWQQHSVRGFLAGTIKKKLGLALTSSKAEGEARKYRIATRRGR